MKETTRQALLAMNRRFYDDGASRFSATRRRPWDGWSELLPELRQAVPGGQTLDVGCGNGRFAAFLAAEGLLPAHYLGLDGSQPLLAEARAALPHPPFEFRLAGLEGPFPSELPSLRNGEFRHGSAEPRRVDENHLSEPRSGSPRGEAPRKILGPPPFPCPRGEGGRGVRVRLPPISEQRGRGVRTPLRFDLIVLFGVLHHVPGRAARQNFLESLAGRLAEGGLLVVSFWLLDRFPARFEKLRLDAGELGPELEAGDALLSFDGRPDRPRYCHFPDDAEIDSLCRLPGCEEVRRFRADGPSGADNLYAVLRHGMLRRP